MFAKTNKIMKSYLTPTKPLREVYVSPDVTFFDLRLEGVLCDSGYSFREYHLDEEPDCPGFGYGDHSNGSY